MTHMPMSHSFTTTATANRSIPASHLDSAPMGDLWNALRNAEQAGVRPAIWETASCRQTTNDLAETTRRIAHGATAIGVLAHMAALMTGHVPASVWSIAPMMLFLSLALLPGVWTPAGLSFLRRARPAFALNLAVWIILHAWLATGAVLAAQPEGWMAHWAGLEVMMGLAGLVIVGAVLAAARLLGTAGDGPIGRLARRALWLIPTIGLVHGWIAAIHYGDSLMPSLAMLLPAVMLVLMPAMAYLMGHDMRNNLQRLCALILGTGMALAMAMLLAPVGGAMSVIGS